MRRFALSSLIVALFGLPLALAMTGCSDDAGGNEEKIVKSTKGTVPPGTAKTPEEYYQKHRSGKR